jgi:hypothetical protein
MVMLGCSMTVVARPGLAQSSAVWMDVGGASLRQPGSTDRSAATAGLGGLIRRGSWTLAGEGALSVAEDTLGAAQVVARASFSPSRFRWSTTELDASATSLGVAWPGNDGNQSVLVRQSVQRGAWRVFGSAGWGKTLRYGLDTRGGVFNAGFAGTRGPVVGTVTLQRATTDDWQLMEASGIVLKRIVPWYVLHDATVDVAWHLPRVSLTASRSWRTGIGDTQGTSNGYALAAAWSVVTPLQLIVQGGKQMADPLRGVPQATYAGVIARWQRSRRTPVPTADAPWRVVRNAEYALAARPGGAELTVLVDAPADAVVEIASSATEWAPVRLSREGARFVARVPLASGTHRVAVRVNGGDWRAPRGLTRVEDEYGGAAGIVVVP